MAVLIVIIHGEEQAIGPFASGDDAARYGFKHFQGLYEWHWLPLREPGNGGH